MKILLDECLPLDFRHSFSDHDAHTAEWAGFKGKTNGLLPSSCRATWLRCLITVGSRNPSSTESYRWAAFYYCATFADKSDGGLTSFGRCDSPGVSDH